MLPLCAQLFKLLFLFLFHMSSFFFFLCSPLVIETKTNKKKVW